MSSPEAPAITPAAPVAPPAAPEPAVSSSVHEARESLFKATEPARREQPRIPAGSREGGQFTVEPARAADSPPASPAPQTPPAEATPAPTEVPDGFVAIEIPPDSPLYRLGATQLVPKGSEQFFRWSLNNFVRRAEREAAAAELTELHDTLLRLRAENDALRQSGDGTPFDPRVLEIAAEVERVYGPEERERYMRGVQADRERAAEERYNELHDEQLSAQAELTARDFLTDVIPKATMRYEGWTEAQLRTALSGYGSWLDAQGREDPSLADFYQYADAAYWSTPGIRDRWTQRQTREQEERDREERIRAEERQRIQDEERQRLARVAAGRNPLAGIPPGSHVPAVGVSGAPPPVGSVAEARARLHGPLPARRSVPPQPPPS